MQIMRKGKDIELNEVEKRMLYQTEGRTIGELLAGAGQRSDAEQLKGHDIMALERFDPEVHHMAIFEVFSGDSPASEKGDRMRLFLTDAGYQKFQGRQEKGEIKIQEHAKVLPGGYLHSRNREKELIR